MQYLKLSVENFVALVTMDAPPVNAVSAGFMEEMVAVFDKISDLDDARVVVLTGAGKIFCAGADIKNRAGKVFEPGERWAHSRRARELGYSIMECKKPVIAAINGPALGAGLGIAVCCDILLCSENAALGLPEVDVGLMGGGRHAMRVCGHSLTRRMMLTGDRIAGPELYRRGIVEACVPLEELMPAAMAMAARIASKSPIASRTAKHCAATIENMTLRDGYRFEQNMTAELGQTEDSREAMRAFVEKRVPVFVGR